MAKYKPDKTIQVDSDFCEMMLWALRYSLGRQTYAVSDTTTYIGCILDKLNEKTLAVMRRDIKEAEERLKAGYKYSMGDPDMDAKRWIELGEKIDEELNRRSSQPKHEQ